MRSVTVGFSAGVFVLFAAGAAFASAICGDLDGDTKVTQADATIINKFLAGIDVPSAPSRCRNGGILQCGDVDRSGYIDFADWKHVQRAAEGLSSPCSVEGFAAATNRTAASDPSTLYEYITVTSVADTNTTGTLRNALLRSLSSGYSGRLVVFDVGTGPQRIVLGTNALVVPPKTVIDGIGSRIAIDAGNIDSNAALRVYNSDVAIRHIRIRNAGVNAPANSGVDAIQIAPKGVTQALIERIAIQRVSVTKSKDGGIEVNGCMGLGGPSPPSPKIKGCYYEDTNAPTNGVVRDVTLAENFIGANGSIDNEGESNQSNNGGGNLTKYGVTRVTMVGNFWEKNLRRNPMVDNRSGTEAVLGTDSLADVRHSLVRSPRSAGNAGWAEVVASGARVNIVNSCFEGTSPGTAIVKIALGGKVYVAGNTIPPNYTEVVVVDPPVSQPSSSSFDPGYCLTRTNRDTVFANAGALPRDPVDTCILNAVANPPSVATAFHAAIACSDP